MGNIRIPMKGVVHGRTIELTEEPGLPEGEEVIVTLEPAVPHRPAGKPGEGLRRSFGGWADEADDLDAYLAWNRRERQQSRPEIEP